MTMDNTTVMLVDDHPVVLDGLQSALEISGGFSVVGRARDGDEAVRMAAELEPDVIIMDAIMPEKDGIEACREIKEVLPDTRVLILTVSSDESVIIDAVAAGATGYLQKTARMENLLSTMRDIARGEFRIPADIAQHLFVRMREGLEKQPEQEMLTDREREILGLYCRGMSFKDISEIRRNSRVTIRNAIYAIQNKLQLGSKQELVVWAVRNGLVDDDRDG